MATFALDRILADRQALDAGPAGGAVADAGVAAADPDIAGDRGQRVGGAVELLAIDGPAGGIAGLQRGRFGGGEFDRQTADRFGRDAGDRGGPFRGLGLAVGQTEQIGRGRRRPSERSPSSKPEDVTVAVRLVVQVLATR